MTALRLLGLTILLLATLECSVEARSHRFRDRRSGKFYVSEDYFRFYNYYKFPIRWYIYSDKGYRNRLFEYDQNNYYNGRFPGVSYYRYPTSRFREGRRYYAYYSYGSGFKKSFKFSFVFDINFDEDPSPYTFTAYPERSGSPGFEDDSEFQEDTPPSDF